eukprot:CAMPEP_0178392830 /NCGR_PEP_ID=MMETSP0689_2-20121128/11879_1 /TAXON_ID=160604 /ORGANISM="Amphidinium massartii, Strain CS-259" /LENGTH=593 /DNA_ID=CAMNT_0020013413 /DNA_START=72 /DNA_END=1853 /DNA_ORIENTATION=+
MSAALGASCGEGAESARSSTVDQVATEADVSLQRKMQDVAAEVLRLRLLQTQHKQLEADLQAASDALQKLPMESLQQFRSYLEQALRPSSRLVTLGSLNSQTGGVDRESLLGLIECLCIICKVRLLTRRPEELMRAMHRLLRDPVPFIAQLVALPVAPLSESKCLAPFLLSSDRGWEGRFSEAGRCYEALRVWLTCYYQQSLASVDIETTNEELHRNEQLLRELSTPLGDGSTGGACGVATMSRSTSAWRLGRGMDTSMRSASVASVGSNLSTGSRSRERSLKLGGSMGSLGSIGTGQVQPRRTPVSSPLRTAFRASERALQKTTSPQVGGRAPRVGTPGRSPSPHQVMQDRKMVYAGPSARLTAPRYAYTQPVHNGFVSARPSRPSPGTQVSVLEEVPKAADSARRQNNPALRARRSPSVQAQGSSQPGGNIRPGASPPKSSRAGHAADISVSSMAGSRSFRDTGPVQPVVLQSRTPYPRAPSSARASRAYPGGTTASQGSTAPQNVVWRNSNSRLSPSASTSMLETSTAIGDAGSGGTGGLDTGGSHAAAGGGATLTSSMSTPALRARAPGSGVHSRQTPRQQQVLSVRLK